MEEFFPPSLYLILISDLKYILHIIIIKITVLQSDFIFDVPSLNELGQLG